MNSARKILFFFVQIFLSKSQTNQIRADLNLKACDSVISYENAENYFFLLISEFYTRSMSVNIFFCII